MRHEARQVPSWLIFDVGQKVMKRFFILAPLFFLVGCGVLPSKEKAARIYEGEHRGRKVVTVEQKIEGQGFHSKAFFEVTYTSVGNTTPQKDVLKYHRVAEGWVRSPP